MINSVQCENYTNLVREKAYKKWDKLILCSAGKGSKEKGSSEDYRLRKNDDLLCLKMGVPQKHK